MGTALDGIKPINSCAHVAQEREMDLLRLDNPCEEPDTLRVLQTLSLAVSRAPEIAQTLDQALDQLLTLTKADTGAIHVAQQDTDELRLVAHRGLSDQFWMTECRIPRGVCLCGRSAFADGPMVVDDLASDPRLERPACLVERVGALVVVPFRSRGRTFGMLTLYSRRSGAFADIDRDLLHAIGLHLGAAMDTAAWGANMRERAVANERHVIASELHDGVAQSLAYINLQVKRVQELLGRGAADGAMRELNSVRGVIQNTYDDVRQLLSDFRIAPIASGSFGAALGKQLEAFELQTGIRTELVGEDAAGALSLGQQSEVFRIIQEALANVRKHAQASAVRITCECEGSWCRVQISDNGVGFELARLGETSGLHVGTSIIRERAARLHGHVTIHTEPGKGTAVTIAVPLPLDEERSAR